LIDQGEDPREEKKLKEAAIEASRQHNKLTVKVAFDEYLKGKRRSKDNFELKPRTKSDYLAMLEKPRPRKTKGKTSSVTMGGMLHEIADKPLAELTSDDIRKVFQKAAKRSERQSGYSMQALRAVMNWHGVRPEQNPFDKSLAGKHRVSIAPSRASKKPIQQDRLGEFWLALQGVANEQARDYFAFLLMTGTRVSEPMMIKVADYDRRYGRVVLKNTKNRSDHTILLSRQVAEIVERRIAGKKAQDHIFDLADGKKTQAKIIAELGEKFRPKDMRSTFATIASRLVMVYVLKRLMNHANTPLDVTSTNYVEPSDEEVRAGWQAVADYIENEGRKAAKSAEVVDMAGARQTRAKGAA
jgi:integrase